MSSSYWRKLAVFRYRDIPFVFLGAFLGYHSDVTCAVEGVSMVPTLVPRERICYCPYSLLLWMNRLFGMEMVKEGDVVVVKIHDHLFVCKRVVKLSTDAHVAEEWGEEHYERVIPAYYPPAEDDGSIASPGSALEFSDEQRTLAETSMRASRSTDWDTCVDRVQKPSAWMWLEGDNKAHSFDSRNCGAVPVECLRGKVLSVLWPKPRLLGGPPH